MEKTMLPYGIWLFLGGILFLYLCGAFGKKKKQKPLPKYISIPTALPQRNSKFYTHRLNGLIRIIMNEAITRIGGLNYETAWLIYIDTFSYLADPEVDWVRISQQGSPLLANYVFTSITKKQLDRINNCSMTLHVHNHPDTYNLESSISHEDIESVVDITQSCNENRIRFFVVNSNSFLEYPYNYLNGSPPILDLYRDLP
jgi:hypothetical protein